MSWKRHGEDGDDGWRSYDTPSLQSASVAPVGASFLFPITTQSQHFPPPKEPGFVSRPGSELHRPTPWWAGRTGQLMAAQQWG
jgi:hypothetical protein